MGKACIEIERRFASPSDPDYTQDLEICAEVLLKLAKLAWTWGDQHADDGAD